MEQQPHNALYIWDIPEEPITDIARRVETEILIVGAGVAGVIPALAASEEGAKVIVLSKDRDVIALGGSCFAFNSRLTKKFGKTYDLTEVMQRVTEVFSRRVNERAWSIFLNRSGEVMDWAMDYGEAGGLTPVLQNCEPFPHVGEYFGTHLFIGGKHGPDITGHAQLDLIRIMKKAAVEKGVDFHFRVKAKQLVRRPDGERRVTGVIALEKDGTYTEYVGKKGVILATGDYGKNKEMMRKFHSYLPGAYKPNFGGNGDGHVMALRIGGAWQKNDAHALIMFDFAGESVDNEFRLAPGNVHVKESYFAFNTASWQLAVNRDGERFHNELCTFGWHSRQMLMQPERKAFNIYDQKCIEASMPLEAGHLGGKPITMKEAIKLKCCGEGYPTLEAFAEAHGLPVDTFVKTVGRYNELCHKGYDEDFFKPSYALHPIENPPYYGGECIYFVLIPVGGLSCNHKMQALDKNDDVITGLYYNGTMAGDFFDNLYTTMMPGANLGRTMTFGYITGKMLAGQTLLTQRLGSS